MRECVRVGGENLYTRKKRGLTYLRKTKRITEKGNPIWVFGANYTNCKEEDQKKQPRQSGTVLKAAFTL